MIYPLDYPTFKQLGSFHSRVHFNEEENAQLILGQKKLEFFLIMSEKREVQKKSIILFDTWKLLARSYKHVLSKIQKERLSLKFSSNNQFGIIESFPNTAFVH